MTWEFYFAIFIAKFEQGTFKQNRVEKILVNSEYFYVLWQIICTSIFYIVCETFNPNCEHISCVCI